MKQSGAWSGGAVGQDRPIDVAICTHNRPELCERAVTSALAQRGEGARACVIVVENGPDINLRERLKSSIGSDPRVLLITDPHPGLSRARNTAIAQARTPYLAFLDDDAVTSPDWLEALHAAFRSFEKVGIVGGVVQPEFETPHPPWFSDDLLSYLSAVNWGGALRPAGPWEWFAGANFAVDVNAVRMAGGFRNDLGRVGNGDMLLSGEESELRMRLVNSGFLAVWQPQAIVRHRTPGERLTQPWLRRRASWQAVSDAIYRPAYVARIAARWETTIGTVLGGRKRHRRALRALFRPVATPAEFSAQVSAIYGLTAVLLAGQDLASGRDPGLFASLTSKLNLRRGPRAG